MIEIDGYKNIVRRLLSVSTLTKTGVISGIDESLNLVQKKAIELLNSQTIGLKYYYAGQVGEKINNNWVRQPTSDKGIYVIGSLYNKSPHAAFVEFGTGIYAEKGGGDVITPKDENNLLRFQYAGRFFNVPFVKGQHPKAYFRGARDSYEHRLLGIIGDHARRSILGGI